MENYARNHLKKKKQSAGFCIGDDTKLSVLSARSGLRAQRTISDLTTKTSALHKFYSLTFIKNIYIHPE